MNTVGTVNSPSSLSGGDALGRGKTLSFSLDSQGQSLRVTTCAPGLVALHRRLSPMTPVEVTGDYSPEGTITATRLRVLD